MGATLSAGLSLKWLNESILKRDSFEDLTSETEDLEPGSGGLIYLPYLTGERTPHMDPEARGVFFGLSLHHKAANLVRAVMEGVAYSLRESLDIFHELGIKTGRIIASGGGARSHLWRRILSDVFGEPVSVLMTGRCGNPSPSKPRYSCYKSSRESNSTVFSSSSITTTLSSGSGWVSGTLILIRCWFREDILY
jgi:sugar (pentulose or hexulose) kinase